MNKSKWKPLIFWILFTEAVGALSGLISRTGMEIYNTTIEQPPLSPPGIVFPIVWGILYALMGIGIARIVQTPASDARSRSILIFGIQLIFNFFWSIIFFRFQAFGFAFLWLILLWILILLMILSFRKVDPLAALLQVPYFLWVTFAAYLNFAIWLINK